MRRTGFAAAWIFILAALLAIGGTARADPVLVDGRDRIALWSFEMLRDPGRTLTVADIRGAAAGRFVPAPELAGDFALGFTSDALWLRIEVVVEPSAAGRHFLMLDIPNFDQLEVWGSWVDTGTSPLATLGDQVATTVPTRLPAAVIDMPAGRHTLWLRGLTTGAMAMPLDLWRPEALWAAEQTRNLLHTALAAFVVLLGLGALLMAVTLRSLPMALFAGSALASAGHIMAMTGIDSLILGEHFFSDNDNPLWWRILAAVFGGGFLLAAMPLRLHARWAIPALGIPTALGALLLLIYYPYLDAAVRPPLVLRPSTLSLAILVIGTVASLQCRLAGYRPATHMLLGWLALATGLVVNALRSNGIIPWTEATYYLPNYAPVLEMLFFGVMLTAQLRQLRIEKDRTQQALVSALRRNEAELAGRVAERTAALDRANAALGERAAQLRLILEAAPLPIVLSHATWATTLYANRRARVLFFGGSDEAVLPHAASLYCDPADRSHLLALLVHDGVADNVEIRMNDGAGGFWALASMVAIDYEGRPAHMLAVNDISRHKQLEQELTKAKELAEAATRLERAARETQRQFLAMISHEFRNPLAVISIASQNLGLKADSPAALERLARIDRAVRHMNGMIDACLLDDRIEGGGFVLRAAPVDLATLARRVADGAQAAAPHHVFALDFGDVPETAGDEPLLGMALSNLMENAAKYSPRGGAIDVTLRAEGGEIIMTVADRGPGVPEDDRERIFEKYYRRAEAATVPGAGLGLYLARRIVAAHGGAIAVGNRPGGGARFVLRLPLQSAFAPQRDAAA